MVLRAGVRLRHVHRPGRRNDPFCRHFGGTYFASTSGAVQNDWQYLYELIHRSNTVIRNVSAMDIDQSKIDPIIGEAKFLRAMTYFRMLNCWGGVPYYDETCIIEEEFATVRSSVEDIREHIIDDLTDAIAKLPVSWAPAITAVPPRERHMRSAAKSTSSTKNGQKPFPNLKKSHTTRPMITAMSCTPTTKTV